LRNWAGLDPVNGSIQLGSRSVDDLHSRMIDRITDPLRRRAESRDIPEARLLRALFIRLR
jgi:hypothetical protein